MAKTIRKSDKRNDNQNFINNHSKYYFLIVSFNFYSFVYGFFYSCSQTRIGILCHVSNMCYTWPKANLAPQGTFCNMWRHFLAVKTCRVCPLLGARVLLNILRCTGPTPAPRQRAIQSKTSVTPMSWNLVISCRTDFTSPAVFDSATSSSN